MEYLFGGEFFLLPIFKQEARHLSHLSLCQLLSDMNWGRGREMKDCLGMAQCAVATCQAKEHTEFILEQEVGAQSLTCSPSPLFFTPEQQGIPTSVPPACYGVELSQLQTYALGTQQSTPPAPYLSSKLQL